MSWKRKEAKTALKKVELSFENATAMQIIQEFEPYLEKQNRFAFVDLQMQALYVTESNIKAVYSDFEHNYYFTFQYFVEANLLKASIIRTRKLNKPNLWYLNWQYDVDYFKHAVGEFNRYVIVDSDGKDTFYFIVNNYGYQADPITGVVEEYTGAIIWN